MDNGLKELLQSVIRAELVPVNERLERIEIEQQGMKEELQGMKQEQQGMKEDLDLVKRAVLETNDRLKNVETILENQHKTMSCFPPVPSSRKLN